MIFHASAAVLGLCAFGRPLTKKHRIAYHLNYSRKAKSLVGRFYGSRCIRSNYCRSNDSSLFKRDWVEVAQRQTLDPIVEYSSVGTKETMFAVNRSSGFTSDTKALHVSLSVAKDHLGLNPAVDLSIKRPENEKMTDHYGIAESGAHGDTSTSTPFERLIATPESISIAHKLQMLQLDSSPGPIKTDTESERENLVERHWSPDVKERCPDASLGRFHFEPLKVMSFNSLARSLVDYKYNDNNRRVMSWSSRKFAILDVISQANADVVCLQEIDQEEHENFFLAEFQDLGYASVYKKKKSPKLDGVCILYKESRFDCLFHKEVEFSVHDANYDKVQVAVITALVDKTTRTEGNPGSPVKDLYIVANTHLLFNKNRGDIKFAQLCAMLSAVKDAETKCIEHLGSDLAAQPRPAIIMCGDYNFTPQSLLYHFLSNGYAAIRNCNAKLISGQYLMFDWNYKTEQSGHAKSGITVGNFEGNYMSDIYGPGNTNDWVEPLSKTPSIELFTRMPEWIKANPHLQDVIARYLQLVAKRGRGEDSPLEAYSPIRQDNPEEKLELSEEDLLYCPYNFSSAYSMYNPGLNSSNEPAFTAFHGWQRGCVDYIWYTKDELEVESIYGLPSYGDVTARGNLPNKGWPSSDHFSLISQFKRRV